MGSIIYYIILFLFTVIYLVPLCLLFVLTVFFDRERVLLHKASRFWAMTIFRLCPGWKIKKEGFGNIDMSKPYVVIVNHQSVLDIPLMYVLPFNFKWVSKKEVLKWPAFGLVLRMHGDIIIDRGNPTSAIRMIDEAKKRLDNGTSIVIFPEGTRSRSGEIGRFKEGAFLLAQKAGVSILPVVTHGTGSVTDGWKVRMPHTFYVRVLDPVSAERVAATPVKELAAELNERMREEHAKLSNAKG